MHIASLFWCASVVESTQYMQSRDFQNSVDSDSGALLSIVHPQDNASMSWISGPGNTPWQPFGSRWGLGYVDLGPLHRTFWRRPHVTVEADRMRAVYTLDGLVVDVTRTLNDQSRSLQECYAFTNTGSDGRERVGMGVLTAHWLQEHHNADVEGSLRIYYDYVNNKLQEADGYVRSWPIGARDGSLRLYNWPWVMQLHLQMAKLGNKETTSHGNSTATPSQRLLHTVNCFYKQEDALDYYPINLPIHEGLRYFNESGNEEAVQRLLELFTAHNERIAQVGGDYPSSEVNYEQSIVAPAAITLLELYRYTGDKKWLDAAQGHCDRLEAFGGRQPDSHLHDIAIRHWDGYWFGNDRMWGVTFPHYWSTLSGIAMHHYARATGDDFHLRGNLVLFDEEGRGYCSFIYFNTVDGRGEALPGSVCE